MKIKIENKEYKVYSQLEKDLDSSESGKTENVSIIKAKLAKYTDAERFQIECIYEKISKLGFRQMGVQSEAVLAITLADFVKSEKLIARQSITKLTENCYEKLLTVI